MQKDQLITDYEPVIRPRRTEGRSGEPADEIWSVPTAPADGNAPAVQNEPAVAGPSSKALPPAPRKRGHALTYAGLFLFTVVLYFRPYELFPALSGFRTMAFWIAITTLAIFFPTQFLLEGNLTARPREVNLVLLFVVVALFSIPLALNRTEAWETFNDTFIKAVLVFIIIVNAVRTERRLHALLWLGLAVACFLGVSAINDYRVGRLTDSGTRVAGVIGNMFGNPNDMALHLVTMVPLAIAFFFVKRNPLTKLACAAGATLLVAGIVVSFSRGGFLGLLGTGGVLAWKLGRRRKLAVGVCILLAAVAFVALAPGEYGARLGTITDVSSDVTGSSSERQALLIRSIQVSLRHPLLGIGMGNFHIVSIHEAVSHNAFTQVSAEMGLTAIVLYVWFMVTPLRGLRQIERETFVARRASRFYYFAVALQAALVGYMVSSFFGSVAYHFYVYYLVGYAVCLRRLYQATRGENGEQTPGTHAAGDEIALIRDEGAPGRLENLSRLSHDG
jgi:putative inorganic carbon (hco3(-)) transporter